MTAVGIGSIPLWLTRFHDGQSEQQVRNVADFPFVDGGGSWKRMPAPWPPFDYILFHFDHNGLHQIVFRSDECTDPTAALHALVDACSGPGMHPQMRLIRELEITPTADRPEMVSLTLNAPLAPAPSARGWHATIDG